MSSRFSKLIVTLSLTLPGTLCMGQSDRASGDATREKAYPSAASPYAPPHLPQAKPAEAKDAPEAGALREAIRNLIQQQEQGRTRLGEILRQQEHWMQYSQQMLRRAEQLLEDLMSKRRTQPDQAVVQQGPLADRKGEQGFRALYTMDRDGTNLQYLAAAPGMISSSSPEWSHDATMIAFDGVPEVGALGDAHLFVYALKGPFKGMFRDFGCGNVPSWSPDDRRIAYMVNGGNPCGVEDGTWIMDSDGSNRQRICPGWYPRWSPDGKRLHVYAYFDRPASMHIVDLETRKVRKILGESMEVKFGGGTWSPDGKRLVFVGIRDGNECLATIDVDGKQDSLRTLYTEKDRARELIGPPAWSPDGKQIVFAIQEKVAGSSNRRWHHTYLYSISAEVPSAPVLLQAEKSGLVNRSPMWSPDSSTVVFSSER